MAVFLALALGLGVTSFAAARSLPGDPLYPLKRAMEEVRVQLSPSSARSDALVDVARERVREVRILMESEASTEAVDAAVEGFENAAKRALEGEADPGETQQQMREIEKAVDAEPEPVKERVEQGSGGSPSPPAEPEGSGDTGSGADAQGPQGQGAGPAPGSGTGGNGEGTQGGTQSEDSPGPGESQQP